MWASGQCEEQHMRDAVQQRPVCVCNVMSVVITVCLVSLRDQIRWISCSLT